MYKLLGAKRLKEGYGADKDMAVVQAQFQHGRKATGELPGTKECQCLRIRTRKCDREDEGALATCEAPMAGGVDVLVAVAVHAAIWQRVTLSG